MNWIDIVILILLGISLIGGLSNGFIKELSSFAALILGIWGAIKFSSFTAVKLYEWFDMAGEFVGLVSFIVTFLVIVVVINFVGVAVDKVVNAISLGFLNKILGAVFSVFKSVLILSVIFFILETIDSYKSFMPEKKIAQSRLYEPIRNVAPMLFPIIKNDPVKDTFDTGKEEGTVLT
ncbi:MAG TPA: CvpA family protein [Bacteroidetes bacterium]|nr:CvpA family protein [Bacteroidota bacterium]